MGAVDDLVPLLKPVDAGLVPELLELVAVGIDRRLDAVADGLSLPPMLVLLDSLPDQLCACCVHGFSPPVRS